MKFHIPHSNILDIETIILDLNGTLTVRGVLVDGVAERIHKLLEKGLRIVLFSGDTRGTGKSIAERLGIDLIVAGTGEEKKMSSRNFNPLTCAAIGNGLIDVPLFGEVTLAIAVMQAEGVHVEALHAAHILVPSILDALDLFIDDHSLIATLRP